MKKERPPQAALLDEHEAGNCCCDYPDEEMCLWCVTENAIAAAKE